MNVAILPARGGSKRIPGKNSREFCGRPMIHWSLTAARASGCFDRIIVSTDDPTIAAIAVAEGAEVPFMRPPALSDDHTPTIPVIAHAIQMLVADGYRPDHVCCIYATAPLLDPDDLRAGLRAIGNADYAFSCTTFPFPVHRALLTRADGGVVPLFPESISKRSQDLPEVIHDAGQFYWGRPEAFAEGRPIFSANSVPVLIPRYRVQDIDTPEDWVRAELMFQSYRGLPK